MKKPSLQVDANGSLSAAWSLPADTKPSKRKGERITGDSRKTVVITGVSRGGIGEACALHFAQKGFHVYGSVRKAGDAAELQQMLGTQFTPLSFDMTDVQAVRNAAELVNRDLHGYCLTALVSNAGISISPHPLTLIPSELVRRQFEVNVLGTMQVIQSFAPLLGAESKRIGSRGSIAIMSSVYGSYGMPFNGVYCASKAALERLADALRVELSIHGIRVFVIRLGPAKTNIWVKAENPNMSEGQGDWHAYDKSEYSKAIQQTHDQMRRYIKTNGKLVEPQLAAEGTYKAVTSSGWKTYWLITGDYMANWAFPTWAPRWLLTRALCSRFGIRQLQVNQQEIGKVHHE